MSKRNNKLAVQQELDEWEKPLIDGSLVSGPIVAFAREIEEDYIKEWEEMEMQREYDEVWDEFWALPRELREDSPEYWLSYSKIEGGWMFKDHQDLDY